MFLEISQNSKKSTCAGVSFLIKLRAKAGSFIKKETLAQIFSCEFCEMSKNIFLTKRLCATASLFNKFVELQLWNLSSNVLNTRKRLTRQSTEIKQNCKNQKTLKSISVKILAAMTLVLFLEGKMETRLCLEQTSRFSWYILVS